MSTYEVIVGNVGSVHYGERRAEALKRYSPTSNPAQEDVVARCYGEDVTLLVDGEIKGAHRASAAGITKYTNRPTPPKGV